MQLAIQLTLFPVEVVYPDDEEALFLKEDAPSLEAHDDDDDGRAPPSLLPHPRWRLASPWLPV